MANINQLKKLRSETEVSLMECKKALEEADGDLEKAKEILRKKGLEFAKAKKERRVGEGIIEAYIHANKKMGALLELRCETDFVARSQDFQRLAHELCLHIAGMSPADIDSLLEQSFVKDPAKTVRDLIDEYIAKLGENITVERFIRYEI